MRIKPFYEETHKTDNPNYWILVVTDKLEQDLTAKQILTTRMNDKFWGLNAKTPSLTLLRKNDRVVFSYGAKEFLGTAVLDSDPFELTEAQANQFSHGNEFFKTNFGVRLRETELWEDPKPVRKYVDVLSFIKNKSTLCPVCGKYGFLTKRWVQGCYYPKLFHDAIDESDTKAVVMTRATRRKYRYTRKYYHFYIGHYDKEKYKERMKKYKEHKIKSRPNGRRGCHVSSIVKFYPNDPTEIDLRRQYNDSRYYHSFTTRRLFDCLL